MDEEAARTSASSAETWGRFDFERLERGFDVYSCEDRIQDEYTRRCALQNALREIMLAPGPLREGKSTRAGSDAFNAGFDAGTSDDGDEDARVLMEEIWTTPCGSFPGVFAMLADSSSKTRKRRALLTEREARRRNENECERSRGERATGIGGRRLGVLDRVFSDRADESRFGNSDHERGTADRILG